MEGAAEQMKRKSKKLILNGQRKALDNTFFTNDFSFSLMKFNDFLHSQQFHSWDILASVQWEPCIRKYIVAVCTIAKNRKQQCPSAGKCVVNCVPVRMEYYVAVEIRGPLPNAATGMHLRIITLNWKDKSQCDNFYKSRKIGWRTV